MQHRQGMGRRALAASRRPGERSGVATRNTADAKGRGLRAHIVALVASALLPAFAVAGVAVWTAVASYQRAFDERLRDTSRTLALAVDREIDAHIAGLTALA